MSLLNIRDICRGEGCGKLTLIVNKKYFLCDDCNFKRTHNGQTKQEVHRQRTKDRDQNKLVKNHSSNDSGTKTRNKVKDVSSKERYRCSDGSMVSQREININLKIVKQVIQATRLPMCQGSGRWDVPLSNSHTISVARCKALGKTELIWDEDNIELEGFEAPTSNPIMSHNIWEVGSIEKKVRLLNFERKLAYIAKHDNEQYQKLKIQIDELHSCADTEGL